MWYFRALNAYRCRKKLSLQCPTLGYLTVPILKCNSRTKSLIWKDAKYLLYRWQLYNDGIPLVSELCPILMSSIDEAVAKIIQLLEWASANEPAHIRLSSWSLVICRELTNKDGKIVWLCTQFDRHVVSTMHSSLVALGGRIQD